MASLVCVLFSNMPSRLAVSLLGGLSNHRWSEVDTPIVGSPDRSEEASFRFYLRTAGPQFCPREYAPKGSGRRLWGCGRSGPLLL